MERHQILAVILFAALLINSSIAVYLAIDRNSCESCEMRFNKTDMSGINGVHKYDKYICVWTEDREPDEIGGTFSHEMAHFFVKSDYYHFCVEYNREDLEEYCK